MLPHSSLTLCEHANCLDLVLLLSCVFSPSSFLTLWNNLTISCILRHFLSSSYLNLFLTAVIDVALLCLLSCYYSPHNYFFGFFVTTTLASLRVFTPPFSVCIVNALVTSTLEFHFCTYYFCECRYFFFCSYAQCSYFEEIFLKYFILFIVNNKCNVRT